MGWDYCCCAIPVLNVGAYFTLTEQFILGILVGTLSFATPSLVAGAVPFAAASYVLCGLGYAFAVVQMIGFLGVFQEKTTLFRRYVAINMVILYAGLSVAATYIAISAARHGVAVEKCQKDFFTDNSNITSGSGEGQQICNIFCWATLGAMGALLILLFVVQSYLAIVLSKYGASQRADHTKYHSIYSTHDGGNNIMLNNVRAGNNGDDEEAWNSRPSTDSWHPRGETAYRDEYEPGPSKPPSQADKGTGYGVGMGHSVPLKQASLDQAYLDHPSKVEEVQEQTKKHGSSYYDPPELPPPPPSYHDHDSPNPGLPIPPDKYPLNEKDGYKDQAFNPYQASTSKF